MNLAWFVFNAFKIGCIGFGGGSSLIPLVENVYIGEGKLDSNDNFNDDILVASISPGALPVELISSLGWRKFGIKGMLFGTLAVSLPGVMATIIMLICFNKLRSDYMAAIYFLTVLSSVYIICVIATVVSGTNVVNFPST